MSSKWAEKVVISWMDLDPKVIPHTFDMFFHMFDENGIG